MVSVRTATIVATLAMATVANPAAWLGILAARGEIAERNATIARQAEDEARLIAMLEDACTFLPWGRLKADCEALIDETDRGSGR